MMVMEFCVNSNEKASLTNPRVQKREWDTQMHSFDGQNALVGGTRKIQFLV